MVSPGPRNFKPKIFSLKYRSNGAAPGKIFRGREKMGGKFHNHILDS